MNIVMDENEFIEIQGTAEGKPFSKAELDKLLELGTGAKQIIQAQMDVLGIKALRIYNTVTARGWNCPYIAHSQRQQYCNNNNINVDKLI